MTVDGCMWGGGSRNKIKTMLVSFIRTCGYHCKLVTYYIIRCKKQQVRLLKKGQHFNNKKIVVAAAGARVQLTPYPGQEECER